VTATTTEARDGVRTRLFARPPAMRGQPYVWLLIFLAFVTPMRFAPGWDPTELRLFDQWLVYTILVVGFFYVFGRAARRDPNCDPSATAPNTGSVTLLRAQICAAPTWKIVSADRHLY